MGVSAYVFWGILRGIGSAPRFWVARVGPPIDGGRGIASSVLLHDQHVTAGIDAPRGVSASVPRSTGVRRRPGGEQRRQSQAGGCTRDYRESKQQRRRAKTNERKTRQVA